MHALEMRRILGFTVLAPDEFQIGWSTSTNFFQALWGDCGEDDRNLIVALLKKAHARIGRDLIRAKTNEELHKVNVYADRVLTREAVLVANSPEFAPHASDLKDIILEAVGIRINKGVEKIEPEDADLISRFKQVLQRFGI